MGKSFSQLSYEQRLEIKKLLDSGISKRAIAAKIGVHHSTVYREIDRGMADGAYDPEYAEADYQKICSQKGRVPILEAEPQLAEHIARLILDGHLSPEKAAAVISADKRHGNVSTGTIYNAVDNGLIPGVTRESLRPSSSTVFGGGQVVIPKWVMEQLQIKDGDTLHIEVSDDGRIIYKKENG